MSFKTLHKWLSLVVFVQLCIWLGSGFLLGKVDAKKAAGRDTLIRLDPPSVAHLFAPSLGELDSDVVDLDKQGLSESDSNHQGNTLQRTENKPLVSFNSIIKAYPQTRQIALSQLLSHPVYKLKIDAGRHAYQLSDYKLIDAITGQRIDLADATMASKNSALIYAIAYQSHTDYSSNFLSTVSLSNYHNATDINPDHSATLLSAPIADLPRERNAVWQVNTNDASQTSIYIRAQTGEVIAHVNDETRWRDLLLMLHFMDYAQQGTFNNYLMKIFATLTLLLAGTGLWWLARLFRDGQIKITWFARNKTLLVRSQNALTEITLTGSANASILSTLAQNNIAIQAICGGGGVCGTCAFTGNPELAITKADKQHFTANELALGYRLACQHQLKEVASIELPK